MTMILNLTQHAATPDQVAAGVVDPPPPIAAMIRQRLTFETLPTGLEIQAAAAALAIVAETAGAECAMIGGAPYLMSALEQALTCRGVWPVYAFSRRESVEELAADGTVRKVNVFRHAGFVPAVMSAGVAGNA